MQRYEYLLLLQIVCTILADSYCVHGYPPRRKAQVLQVARPSTCVRISASAFASASAHQHGTCDLAFGQPHGRCAIRKALC